MQRTIGRSGRDVGSRHDQTNPEIYKRVQPYIRGRRTAIDCGAYHGEWTRLLRQDFARVVAFEIREDSAERIPREDGITVHCAGLGARNESKRFALRHGIYLQIERAEHYPDKPRFDLPVSPLDSYNIEDVDLIKLDVDGMEADVLYGASETIAKYRPVMVVEVKLMKDNIRADLLGRMGYRVADKVSWIDEVWMPA